MDGEIRRSYRAYLLRCWQEEGAASDGEPLWRFSVEEILPFGPSMRSAQGKLRAPHERRRRGFSSLDALVGYLKARLAGDENAPSCQQ